MILVFITPVMYVGPFHMSAASAAINAPKVNTITDQDTKITGSGDKSAVVYVKVGSTIISRGRTTSSGNFSITIPKQKANTLISVVTKNNNGTYSSYAKVNVQSKTPVVTPIVNTVLETDKVVTGKAEKDTYVYVKVGSTIIGRGRATSSGNFSVTIPVQKVNTVISVVTKNTSGKYSPYTKVSVQGKAHPSTPTVNAVLNTDKVVTGKAEKNTYVYVKVGSTIIGRGRATSSGNYSITISPQAANTTIAVVVKDTSGKYSPYCKVKVTEKEVSFEEKVVELTNIEREKAGLPPLKIDSTLMKVSQQKAQDMSTNHYFDHTSPTYGTPYDMMSKAGIVYSAAGENIAWGHPSPEAVVKGWMNSPGHRANILNNSFTYIGVGHTEGDHYWVQMFYREGRSDNWFEDVLSGKQSAVPNVQ